MKTPKYYFIQSKSTRYWTSLTEEQLLDRCAATIHAQLSSHNESIDKLGYCAECRRLKGPHETHKTDSREA